MECCNQPQHKQSQYRDDEYMTGLIYITKNNKQENSIECVTQSEFELFLKESYPDSRPNGIIHCPNCTERSYHIMRDNIEIAKIKATYGPERTEVLIEGRKSAEVLAILKAKNGFNWEDKNKPKPNITYARTNNMKDIADYFHSM